MEQIRFDKRNYRNHSDKNKATIRRSLAECGAGRSVVVDSEGELIAGNGVYEQAKKLGIKTRVIETETWRGNKTRICSRNGGGLSLNSIIQTKDAQ